MTEIKTDLWKEPCTGICITTNGFVKPNGRAVMGRGCALEAKQKIADIDYYLGWRIKNFGNHVQPLCYFEGKHIYSFPVKHNWWEDADLDLIKRSCEELHREAVHNTKILLPRPGCGNGHLRWEYVGAAIKNLLPANVVVVYK